MILEVLKQKRVEEEYKYNTCIIMMDAMSIKHHLTYSKHADSISGFVDIGLGEESDELATEILVIMAVGVNGFWKIPLAYFNTNGLTSASQKFLIMSTLQNLKEIGIKVIF